MEKQKVLVTGATGKSGAEVVSELLKKGWPVRALVSRTDWRSDKLKSMGAEVVVADMYDPVQLTQALQGTKRAYYLTLFQPYMIQAAASFAVAAKEARLDYIVQLSQWTASDTHPALMTRQTWLVDQLFSSIPGIAHTILNPGMFADNFLRMMDMAALLGIFPVLMGDSMCAPISNEDLGKAAAALLTTDPSLHAGKKYRPTGPKLLSGKDMATIISGVVGHRVWPIRIPLGLFLKVAQQSKVDRFEVASLIHYIQDNRQGAFSFRGGVTRVMEDLTGSPAEAFEATAKRYAELPFARQTFGNRVKAFVSFNMAPFYPGYNLKRFEKELRMPLLPNPQYCMENERWKKVRLEQMELQGVRNSLGNI